MITRALKYLPQLVMLSILYAMVTACSQTMPLKGIVQNLSDEPTEQSLVLTRTTYEKMPKWHNDDHDQALATFAKSCDRIMKLSPNAPVGSDGMYGYAKIWQAPCRNLSDIGVETLEGKPDEARRFFEAWFTPYYARGSGFLTEGLFTGYYEPSLDGSFTPDPRYNVPLYQRPSDLIEVSLSDFRDDLRGRRIAGRIEGNRLVPYPDRAAINAGAIEGKTEPLLWVDDPIDAFFLHIQGSGQVVLPNKKIVRVGYDGQNGHPYYAIGRELVQRGELEKEQVSLQTIRTWLESYPEQAEELKNLNPSYIFFRELKGDGPIGGEGVILTPKRSLAIDPVHWAYGIPVWLEAEHPVFPETNFYQLTITQDTGGAIKGPIRGDLFWGSGHDAMLQAGQMKSDGKVWALLPTALGERFISSRKQ